MRVLAMAAAVLVAVNTTLVSALPAHAYPDVTRADMINRARSWLTAGPNHGPVPYSQQSRFEGYRQDCSGYVSMAAKIDQPGKITTDLADRLHSKPISLAELRWGDIIVNTVGDTADGRHVVIFEKWADPYRTAYHAYEQRGVHGTTYRVLRYGLSQADNYWPRRLFNVID
ncbi:hypothetical protein OG205_08360 [Lentzea sp. NBC_00516]|uniref:hypothetical protein n=1 Tax=Lentzea sp. NBC_00516 TaxID=2903582 RepID=UPI002E8071CE|nr:hypothetical protein [Lentzea sp. NBC_00516]WUD26993.1 hypothetical protein OG205_08360 [Lentzea sp. NBC_00516]